MYTINDAPSKPKQQPQQPHKPKQQPRQRAERFPFEPSLMQMLASGSPVERTLEAALDAGVELFCSAADEPFIKFPGKKHPEIWPLRSPRVRNWLAELCWTTCHKLLAAVQIENLLNVLEGKAWARPRRPVADADAWKLAEQDPLVQAVLEFMAFQTKWNGLASRLLTHLASIAALHKLDGPHARWPRVPAVLGVRLRRAASVLAKLGVVMVTSHTKEGTMISLEQVVKLDELKLEEPAPIGKHGDGGDSKSTLPSPVPSGVNPQPANDLQKTDGTDGSGLSYAFAEHGPCTQVERPSAPP